jgi:pyruvate dehydrogenase E2 component (dihydrolipoamide acetyltransferase)
MPVNVVMPQMGESVAEGTVVRWIKKIGDPVERDEPLFEISTDKVDAEIPSPAAGTLTAIHVIEGQTVPVDTVVAIIAQGNEAVAVPPAPSSSAAADGSTASLSATKPEKANGAKRTTPGAASAASSGAAGPVVGPPTTSAASAGAPAAHAAPAASAAGSAHVVGTPTTSAASAGASAGQASTHAAPRPPATVIAHPSAELSREELRRQRSSPLVRKIAHEHNVDISQIQGSGISGRVTKSDILQFLDHRPAAVAAAPVAAQTASLHVPAYGPSEAVEIVPLSVMRKKIADHMVLSKRTSAHVHSVFEVDFTHVSKIRDARKAEYERLGTKLTFLSFIAKATLDALRHAPVINASLDGDNIVYKKDINLGIAVALEWGLIVPVIKHADEKNLLGLSRAIADLANRARSKQLKPEEVQNGTFTITNPGIFGAQFGMPIINQPQVAILGVGAVEKRAVVIDDAIAIRPRAYLTLGYDHRLVDGAVADQFMSQVKKNIETFDAASL